MGRLAILALVIALLAVLAQLLVLSSLDMLSGQNAGSITLLLLVPAVVVFSAVLVLLRRAR